MTYLEKEAAYQKLISDVRTAYRLNPCGLAWCEDCQEINLWTYWQGRGNFDCRILLVGQDWGNPWAADAQQVMDHIRAMNRQPTLPYLPDPDSPTDRSLIELFASIGYDLCADDPKNRQLFFTNLVLGYRTGKISGSFRSAWVKHDRDFFARLVAILEPSIILCLGKATFTGVLSAFPDISVPKMQSYNRFLESRNNPVILSLPDQKQIRIFALAHCGRLGTLNRNRGTGDRDSLARQLHDWQRILE